MTLIIRGGTPKRASISHDSTARYKKGGLLYVCYRKCRTKDCGKRASFGVAGTKTMKYCARHAPAAMVNICNRKCRTKGCGKKSSFGVAGTKTPEYCAQHALDGLVDVKNRKCTTESCGKKPSFEGCRYKNEGVLCAARTGRDSQRL